MKRDELIAIAMLYGLTIGSAIGYALGDLSFWMSIGLALGALFAVIYRQRTA